MEEIYSENRVPVRYIYRASKTVNGVKYYAKDYGLRGFPIPIYE